MHGGKQTPFSGRPFAFCLFRIHPSLTQISRLNSEIGHDSFAPTSSAETPDSQTAVPVADAVLVAQAVAGDRDAAQVLVLRHRESVTRLLWRFARHRSDLDDLVQDCFLRMLRGLPDWEPRQPFGHWLLRIASNTGRDYFRRQAARRKNIVEPLAEEEPASDAPDPGGDPAARAAANEVKDLLAQLPADDRTLLTLHHLEGWNLEQIAGQFGWTLTATKLRAWRARRRLRTLLSENDFNLKNSHEH